MNELLYIKFIDAISKVKSDLTLEVDLYTTYNYVKYMLFKINYYAYLKNKKVKLEKDTLEKITKFFSFNDKMYSQDKLYECKSTDVSQFYDNSYLINGIKLKCKTKEYLLEGQHYGSELKKKTNYGFRDDIFCNSEKKFECKNGLNSILVIPEGYPLYRGMILNDSDLANNQDYVNCDHFNFGVWFADYITTFAYLLDRRKSGLVFLEGMNLLGYKTIKDIHLLNLGDYKNIKYLVDKIMEDTILTEDKKNEYIKALQITTFCMCKNRQYHINELKSVGYHLKDRYNFKSLKTNGKRLQFKVNNTTSYGWVCLLVN